VDKWAQHVPFWTNAGPIMCAIRKDSAITARPRRKNQNQDEEKKITLLFALGVKIICLARRSPQEACFLLMDRTHLDYCYQNKASSISPISSFLFLIIDSCYSLFIHLFYDYEFYLEFNQKKKKKNVFVVVVVASQ
jgi:hypothetical protein